jgi:hypothetical protein
MKENSLKTLMDCVTIKRNNADTAWCRKANDLEEPGEDIFEKETEDGVLWYCIKPREVIISGPPIGFNGVYYRASLGGVFNACPNRDPNFFNCLCEMNVDLASLNIYAQNFKDDEGPDAPCPQGNQKRGTLPEDVLKLPTYNTSNPTKHLQVSHASFSHLLRLELILDHRIGRATLLISNTTMMTTAISPSILMITDDQSTMTTTATTL